MANIAISLDGIDQAVENLKYRPGSVKQKALLAIRSFYDSPDAINTLSFIDTDTLIKNIWEVGDDVSKIKSKRRNFFSLKSSINSDLKKLSRKDLNPENIIIADANIFDMSEEAKSDLLNSFTNAVKTGDIDLEQATGILKTVTDFLETLQVDTSDNKSLDIIKEIKKILNKISHEVLPDEENLVEKPEGDVGPGIGDGEGQIELADDEELEEVLEEDDLIEELDEDTELVDDEEPIELAEDEELEEVLEEDDLIEELDEDTELVDDEEPIELAEDEELEEVLEEDDLIEELDEDTELVDDEEPIELAEDEELEEVLEEDDLIEELDEDTELVDDEEPIELAEDEELEEVLEEDDLIEELDEDTELVDDEEPIELAEDEELEEVLEEDDLIEELDEDTELVDDEEPIELAEDEELEEVLEEDDLIEELDEDTELVDDEEPIELAEDEELEEIELPEDEEIEMVDGLDKEELKALEDFREQRELAQHFDDTLGEREKKFNVYITVPKGSYTIGTQKNLKTSLALQLFEMPEVHIGRYPVTNSLFEIFVDQTGYVTTAEKKRFGIVYHARYKKNDKTASWNKSAGSENVKNACWHQPSGPGSNLHGKRNHPVVQVSIEDALAYAAWIGRRLPTEAEWESAARTDLGYKYPWGNEFKPTALNIEQSGICDTCPVDEHDGDANDFKIVDLLGNVMEWTSDMEKPPFKTKTDTQYSIAKGGAWNALPTVTISSRALFKNGFSSNTIGFRCISEIFL